MKVREAPLKGVLIIEPHVFNDERGFFLESFNAERYAGIGLRSPFVQDNWSHSVRGTLRGLHFQEPDSQGKLTMVTSGVVWDVAADIRRGSPTFGRWFGVELSAENRLQVWVPPGFAHGFCVLSERADFLYKCTAQYSPAADQAVAWNDPDLAIAWPIASPLLSPKDAAAPPLRHARLLPTYVE